MKWLIEEYRVRAHIDSIEELAGRTGIDVQRLRKRIKEPQTIKLFELKALDKILHFKDEDLLKILKGEV